MGSNGGFGGGSLGQGIQQLVNHANRQAPEHQPGQGPGEANNMNYGTMGSYNTLAQDMSRNVMGKHSFPGGPFSPGDPRNSDPMAGGYNPGQTRGYPGRGGGGWGGGVMGGRGGYGGYGSPYSMPMQNPFQYQAYGNPYRPPPPPPQQQFGGYTGGGGWGGYGGGYGGGWGGPRGGFAFR
jgi:hypothetical protein